MRRRGALLLTGLVFLFFAQAQRAVFGSLFVLTFGTTGHALDLSGLLLALLPLAVLLLPLVPLARWLDRPGATAVAIAGIAVFRLPMIHPAVETRLVAGAMVVGFFALFLTWAPGALDRRSVASGAVLGLVVDQLLRLAGTTYDLSLQPAWLPVQVVLSVALLAGAVAWARMRAEPQPDAGAGDRPPERLERRAAGLRLRGALALGPLLFLDLHVLGLPPVVTRWTGLSYELAGLAAAAAGGAALAGALGGGGVVRWRAPMLVLVTLIGAAVVGGWWLDGAPVGGLMALGHGAALLLIARALNPASGRRSGRVVTAGVAAFVLLTGLFTLTFIPDTPLPLPGGGAPWIFGLAIILLLATGALLPHAGGLKPLVGPIGSTAAALLVTGAAAALSYGLLPAARAHARVAATAAGADAAADTTLRIAVVEAAYGYAADRSFVPENVGEALAGVAPDVAALWGVPAGAPTSYNVDLPLWLEHRLGGRARFSATANGLTGWALFERGSGGEPEGPGGAGGAITVLVIDPGRRGPDRVRARFGGGERRGGAAVVLVPPPAAGAAPLASSLEAAGFSDARDGAAVRDGAAAIGGVGRGSVWVRGLRVESVRSGTRGALAPRVAVVILRPTPP